MLTWHVPVGPAHCGALYGAEAYPNPGATGPREPLRGPTGTAGLAWLERWEVVVVDVVLEGVGSVGQRYPGAENLRPMLAGGMISCPSAACAPVFGPLLHWDRLMSLAQLSTSSCRSSVKVPLPFWV